MQRSINPEKRRGPKRQAGSKGQHVHAHRNRIGSCEGIMGPHGVLLEMAQKKRPMKGYGMGRGGCVSELAH